MRGGAAKAEAIPVRGKTLEGKSPGELHALVGLNRRLEVVDSRVEQSLEGEGLQGLLHLGKVGFGAVLRRLRRSVRTSERLEGFQRQEGTGAGDGVRLHGRSKALKGEPHERIRHETGPAGSGRMKASGG
jgi:hypothetical protein